MATSTGEGGFRESQEQCSLADVDGDGRADLVSFTHDATPQVWVSLAMYDHVEFAPPTLWHSAFCALNQKCLVGDVSRDRILGFPGRWQRPAVDLIALDNGYPTNRVWVARGE